MFWKNRGFWLIPRHFPRLHRFQLQALLHRRAARQPQPLRRHLRPEPLTPEPFSLLQRAARPLSRTQRGFIWAEKNLELRKNREIENDQISMR